MSLKPVKQFTSWSFSRYGDYKQCPLKAKLKHLDKINEPPNAAMERGTLIHKLAEDYIKGAGRALPPELKLLSDELKALRKLYAKKTPLKMVVEDNWAFTRDWEETEWNNWAACWVRIKLDCAHFSAEGELTVTDWKTGRFREEDLASYLEQLELYALSAMLIDDRVLSVRPRLAYTDEGRFFPAPDEPISYTREDIPRLKKLWGARTKAMFADTSFKPTPNSKCRWCWYGQSKKSAGGPGLCKY